MAGGFRIKHMERSYRFQLISANGDLILQGEPCVTRHECLAQIQLLKENVPRAHCFEKISKSNGQFSFVVKKQEGGTLATSELYWSESSRNYAIVMVKKTAVDAVVVEE